MATVSYKNRTSTDYRFTVKSLDDPAIAELKQMLVKRNTWITDCRARMRKIHSTGFAMDMHTQGLRIRPRGPRLSAYAHDTPKENATHYDIYVRDYPTATELKKWSA